MYGHAHTLLASIPLARLGADPRKGQAMRTFRELRAEYAVLEQYDELRNRAGDDYGCGQRYAELRRRRWKLEELGAATPGWELDTPTADELALAFERVGRPRLTRACRDAVRFTPSAPRATRETIRCWQRLERRFVGRSTPTVVAVVELEHDRSAS